MTAFGFSLHFRALAHCFVYSLPLVLQISLISFHTLYSTARHLYSVTAFNYFRFIYFYSILTFLLSYTYFNTFILAHSRFYFTIISAFISTVISTLLAFGDIIHHIIFSFIDIDAFRGYFSYIRSTSLVPH